MSNDSRLLHLVTIALFSAGIVAIGYVELRKLYKPADTRARGTNRQITAELHGEKTSDEVRASLTRDRTFWYKADKNKKDASNGKNQGLAGMLQRMAP